MMQFHQIQNPMIHFKPFYLFSVICFATTIQTTSLSLPGCPEKCGNLTIPFPFGMTSECCFDDTFHITCDTSFDPPKPFLRLLNAQVASISLDGKLEILNSSLVGLEGKEADQILPLVVEWAAGNVACHVAQHYGSRYACQSQHSQCMDSSVGEGHICRCLPGYEGNPYIADGCQDIDDCAISNPCEGVCVNLLGSFKCYCPKGLVGDGRKDGIRCHTQHRINLYAPLLFLTAITVIATILAITFVHNKTRIEDLIEEDRKSNLKMNGGYLLKQKLSRSGSNLEIYDTPAMDSIARNFSDKIVRFPCKPVEFYRGTLPNGVRVIIMTIKPLPESVIERFVDQLIFLSKPHTNLVRVLGCCLDKPEPVIVYERHGDTETTLYDLITRNRNANAGFSREMRLKAAAGVAKGLAHFNYHKWWPRSTRLLHGYICSANVMMDDSYHPKIFYTPGSNLITRDLDEENYISVLRKEPLHKRSDVYNFGEVLVELTGSIRPSETRIVTLANDCLNVDPDKRPNMKEVSKRLAAL